MPITPYLDGFYFDPETKRVMGLAFEMTLAALRLTDWNELPKEIVAKKIIALAQEGMRDPNLLCEWALDDLRKPPSRVYGRLSWRPRLKRKAPPVRAGESTHHLSRS
jgi:hypothetical protein